MSNLLRSYEFGLTQHTDTSELHNIYIEDHFLLLRYCNAINRNGLIIEVVGQDESKIDLNAIENSNLASQEKLIVVLSMDPYEFSPTGSPDPQELPPRQPYAVPNYKFSLVAEDQVQSVQFADDYVIVGRILKEADRYLSLIHI